MKYFAIAFFLVLFTPFATFAQNQNEGYEAEWKTADSLFARGLPKSALAIAEAVYAKAKTRKQPVQILKAQLYILRAGYQTSEEASAEAIAKAEEEIKTSDFPNNAIWHSVAAELYWNYYQQNRWKILDRTSVSDDLTLADFEQWDASRFYQKVAAHYKASLSRAAELKDINIEQYAPILIEGKNTREFRPTLFDLLAFRAIGFFESEENGLTKPAFAFVMDDPKAFAPAGEFTRHNFKTADTISTQYQALRLYQQILRLHIDDAKPGALIDADLKRLQFVYRGSVHPDKDTLYKMALEHIERKYAAHPLSALAAFQLVNLGLQGEDPPVTYRYGGQAEAAPRKDYLAAKNKLKAIISKYPESEGGILAKNLLQSIQRKDLSIQAEEVMLPDEPSKILLTYRNVPKVWMRVVNVSIEDFKDGYRQGSEAWHKKLVALAPLQSTAFNLPATEDLNSHSTELMVDKLPTGMYAAIVSGDEAFSLQDNNLSFAMFQVSALSVIVQQAGIGYVLHRKTGLPVPGATIELFSQRYNRSTRQSEAERVASVKSGKDGAFRLPVDNSGRNYNALTIQSGNDALYLNQYLNIYRYSHTNPEPATKTFFFTDRALYRPGQTIFYKGIMLQSADGGSKNEVLPNQKTEVVFYDVNGQKLGSNAHATNEYGSFSGSFTAPEGVFTGNMRIGNQSGNAHFSVEEYKRPKFYVSFDTLKTDYALNEEVSITGSAMAYAGNTVDGARVNYRVVRQTRWPYYWALSYYSWGFPQRSNEMEISRGTATTDAEGKFQITFKTIPDKSISEKTLPVFRYIVHADVTDINGETRTGKQIVNAGYRSIQLRFDMPEAANPTDLDTLPISTENLNGQFVATNVEIRIYKLKSPDRLLRKRIWDAPDQYIMDEASFRRYFPQDEYKNETDPMTWDKSAPILTKSITTTPTGMVAIPQNTWKENGWYLVEAAARDKNGKEVIEKKYVQVWDKNNKGDLPIALMVLPQQQRAEPGEEAQVHVVSGFDKAYLIQESRQSNGEPDLKQISYSGKPIVWERMLTEEDRGGITLQYLMVKENRVYRERATIAVPWTNKDLNISWETHRDKLKPGTEETWTMVVRGASKDKVAAEMVATLYDASLDAFRPHGWNMEQLFPVHVNTSYWHIDLGFGATRGRQIASPHQTDYQGYEKSYDRLLFPEGSYGGILMSRNMMYDKSAAAPQSVALESVEVDAGNTANKLGQAPETLLDLEEDMVETVPVRTNFNETAFFEPHLRTDADGNIRIQFTIPEALTEWRLMAYAHTKDMRTGLLEGKVKTQKELMVVPGLPRFLRQGDDITITGKISNLSEGNLNGKARLEVLDARTLKPLDIPFRLQRAEQPFTAEKGQSTNAAWQIHVPESLYEPVIIRITATAGNFTDGEEHLLPVVSNRMMVTETLPLWLNGNGTKKFSFDKLKQSGSSETLSQYNISVEYTGNPAWYAVQALPYLMEYPYECAEQVFNRYYAAALAAHIVESAPQIKEIFRTWQTIDTTALLSNLQKNQELKSALLEETPWVLEAQNESEQKKRIAMLFEATKLAATLDRSMQKLEDMLLPEGAFPWFKGMHPDRYITQYIATGLVRLQHLGIKDRKGSMQRILDRTITYLDTRIQEDYNTLAKNKAKLNQQQIGYIQVQYLYLRSFLKTRPDAAGTAYDYYTKQAVQYWPSFNPYMKGMIALALHRKNNQAAANDVVASLRETAIHKEEMGMYWMQPGRSYWWYDAPIEAQALLIECFTELAAPTAEVDAMRVWLLKQKQTQNWATTKATADACYALLLTGTDWLTNQPTVVLQLGEQVIHSNADQEAGTGHFQVNYKGAEISPEMGDITLQVERNEKSTSWGAVYWQYFEDMDKITAAATPLTIKKQLFIQKNTDRGPVLEPVGKDNTLKIGDKVISRIEIMVDRDMEYVHLKDMRASCFEPVNVMSSFKWQGGLGYYESTRDASTNFFFSRLQKGKYVFEYPVFVTNKGDFSNGIASIQCMYAPEFTSHTGGIRVIVE